jgi:hypothetical protein
MVWFFSRGNDSVRVETRFDNASREFVLDVTWPHQPVITERFDDLGTFEARVLAVEAQLEAQSFAQVGTPKILSYGWRGAFTN